MFLLIGVSLVVALIFLRAFFWAWKTKQFEDCYTPAIRILLEDKPDFNMEDSSGRNKNKGEHRQGGSAHVTTREGL